MLHLCAIDYNNRPGQQISAESPHDPRHHRRKKCATIPILRNVAVAEKVFPMAENYCSTSGIATPPRNDTMREMFYVEL